MQRPQKETCGVRQGVHQGWRMGEGKLSTLCGGCRQGLEAADFTWGICELLLVHTNDPSQHLRGTPCFLVSAMATDCTINLASLIPVDINLGTIRFVRKATIFRYPNRMHEGAAVSHDSRCAMDGRHTTPWSFCGSNCCRVSGRRTRKFCLRCRIGTGSTSPINTLKSFEMGDLG